MILSSYTGTLFVQELLQAHLIVEGNRPGLFEFSHATLQDKAYALQLHDRRTQLHLRCGRILETRGDATLSQDIGQHYLKSSEPWRAYAFFLRAAQLLDYRGEHVVCSFLVNLQVRTPNPRTPELRTPNPEP